MSFLPSINSIGGAPSLVASRFASSEKVPVVKIIPFSALPIIAFLKSPTCALETVPL